MAGGGGGVDGVGGEGERGTTFVVEIGISGLLTFAFHDNHKEASY